MSNYFFFITKLAGTLYPLPYQSGVNGNINHMISAKGSMSSASRGVLEAYPVGTIFCSNFCVITGKGSKQCYATGELTPILPPGQAYISGFAVPTDEMKKAYNDYLDQTRGQRMTDGIGDFGEDTLFGSQNSTSIKVAKNTAGGKESLLKTLTSDPKYKVPTVDEDGFFVKAEDWYFLVANTVSGDSTLLLGPAGIGKTELVTLMCKRLGLNLSIYNMGTMQDPLSGLLGVHRLENGSSVFDYASFTQVVQQPGVVLLDELSRANGDAQNILLPCLDGRRELPVDIAGGKDVRNIKVHPECVFIATANMGAGFLGVIGIDDALHDRFFDMEVSYLEAEQEKAVLMKRYGISGADASNIVVVANSVRSCHAKDELSSSLSVRDTLRAAKLVSFGWPVTTALERAFLPCFEGTKTEGERSIVYKMILRH